MAEILAAIKSIKENPYTFKYMSHEITSNIMVASMAIKMDPQLIKYVTGELNNNIDLVDSAISKDGLLLEYASTLLRDNFELCWKATRENDDAIKFVSNRIKSSYECAKALITNAYKNQIKCDLYTETPYYTRAHKYRMFQHFHPSLKSHRLFTKDILESYTLRYPLDIFEYVSDSIKNDREFILSIFKESKYEIKCYCKSSIFDWFPMYKYDKEFIKEIARCYPRALLELHPYKRMDNYEINVLDKHFREELIEINPKCKKYTEYWYPVYDNSNYKDMYEILMSIMVIVIMILTTSIIILKF